MINQPDDVTPYTDAELAVLIDANDNMNTVAAEIWAEKAASYASLVDVKEGSSSRNLGDLYEQALKMSSDFETKASRLPRSSRTRAIERP